MRVYHRMGWVYLKADLSDPASPILAAAAAAKSLQSCPTLCDPTDGSPPGSPVTGILQARTLQWVAIAFLTHPQCMKVKSESEVAQSCPTLRDPMDCSLPGSSAHGIFQARVLEWVAIAFRTLPQSIPKSLGSSFTNHRELFRRSLGQAPG